MAAAKHIRHLDRLSGLSAEERARLSGVAAKFAFCTNTYYLSLIDWDDPDDPIRRIIIPDPAELEDWGALDPSEEGRYTVTPGLEHKYAQTALILVSNRCGGYCRFCFRKRLFMKDNPEVVRDITADLAYIARHPEITDVLLSGGDPLFLSTVRLNEIVRRIRAIDHVSIIRIGSKIPAYNPYRILDDPGLCEMIRRYSTKEKRIYLLVQFNHPRELTPVALEGIDRLQKAGAIIANQTPILRGINDDPAVLADLFRKLSFSGTTPYYLFQCRPALGNHHFVVPVEEAFLTFERAKTECAGLAKRLHYVMSHKTGKIAVIGMDADHIYFKYHQAADKADIGKFMIYRRNPEALWFDDYTGLIGETRIME